MAPLPLTHCGMAGARAMLRQRFGSDFGDLSRETAGRCLRGSHRKRGVPWTLCFPTTPNPTDPNDAYLVLSNDEPLAQQPREQAPVRERSHALPYVPSLRAYDAVAGERAARRVPLPPLRREPARRLTRRSAFPLLHTLTPLTMIHTTWLANARHAPVRSIVPVRSITPPAPSQPAPTPPEQPQDTRPHNEQTPTKRRPVLRRVPRLLKRAA